MYVEQTRKVLASLLLATGLFYSGDTISGMAHAKATTRCQTVGRVAEFANVPTKNKDLRPSLRKNLANLGRQARHGDCSVSIICIAASKSDEDRAAASLRCRISREAVIRGGRLPSWGRDQVKASRKNPGKGLSAGKVYIFFK